MPALPYLTETPPGWAEEVDRWPWRPLRDASQEVAEWDKSGRCPRCEHYMYISLGELAGIPATGETLWAECNCEFSHSDDPDLTGCGANGEVATPRERATDEGAQPQ